MSEFYALYRYYTLLKGCYRGSEYEGNDGAASSKTESETSNEADPDETATTPSKASIGNKRKYVDRTQRKQ